MRLSWKSKGRLKPSTSSKINRQAMISRSMKTKLRRPKGKSLSYTRLQRHLWARFSRDWVGCRWCVAGKGIKYPRLVNKVITKKEAAMELGIWLFDRRMTREPISPNSFCLMEILVIVTTTCKTLRTMKILWEKIPQENSRITKLSMLRQGMLHLWGIKWISIGILAANRLQGIC